MRKSRIQNQALKSLLSFSLMATFILGAAISITYAQDSQEYSGLNKKAIESKTDQELYLALGELKDLYLKDNKYSQFVEYLESLAKDKKEARPSLDYYAALTRYQQLKYLEDTQQWDEYFSQGNNYRDQITASLQKITNTLVAKDALYVYSRLLLWQFHRDQQDAFHEQSLIDLINSCLSYAKETSDIKLLKEVADTLLAYSEKAKAKQVYAVYVEKLTLSDKKPEELKEVAMGFYANNNLELAELLYDAYIGKIKDSIPKEELIKILFDIAKQFVYRDEGIKDATYAQKIFKEIEELAGKEAFNTEDSYLWAFNLEKTKDYKSAKELYLNLIERYPDSKYADEALLKIGIFYTYILKDYKTGVIYFEKLAQQQVVTGQVISALYQLGLLSQWSGDLLGAKNYYNKLIELAKDGYVDTVNSAKERLKEIDAAAPLDYNLKSFLDVSLKPEYAISGDMSKLDLAVSGYRIKPQQEVKFSSNTYTQESGCTQVELQYLWSGDLGQNKPSLDMSSFTTSYASSGTKIVSLIVVSSSGIIDRSLDIVDVE